MSIISDKILQIFSSIFGWIYQTLVAPFITLSSLKDLVFGKDKSGDLLFHTFTASDYTNTYDPGIQATMTLAAFIVLVSIILAGIRIAGTSFNPANRTQFIEFIKDLAIVAIVLANLGTLYSLIFQFNDVIINIFSSAYKSDIKGFQSSIDNGAAKQIVGEIIINLALLGLAIWANFYYMMRKLTLLMLMILGPVMMALYLNPRTKAITGAWLKELIGTVLVQSVHAFTFWLVASMAASQNQVIPSVILYIIFIPVSEGLRSLIGLGGDMNGKFAKAGAMAGMAGLSGVFGAAKGALKDQSFSGALKSAYDGVKGKVTGKGDSEDNKKALGANAGTDTGSTSVAEKMLKRGQIVSKMGKAAAGMAGSISGSTMGPMGAMALGAIGSEMGEKIGGLTGRVGSAGIQAVGDRLKKGKQAFLNAKNNGQSKGIEESLKNAIAEEDTRVWGNKNKKDVMSDLKSRFPDATDQDLDEMWNQKRDEVKKGFRKGAGEKLQKLKDASGKYANGYQLAEQTAASLTNEWAKNNEGNFMRDYEKHNPPKDNMTKSEQAEYDKNKSRAWNMALGEKRKQFGQMTKSTASSMMEGRSQPFIDKNAFADKVGQQATSLVKGDIKAKNPNLSNEEVDVQFAQSHGGKNAVYVDVAKSASNGTESLQLFNGKKVNRDFVTSQLAGMRTDTDSKTAFFADKRAEGLSDNQIQVQWKSERGQKFQENLKVANESVPHTFTPQISPLKLNTKAGVSGAMAALGVTPVANFAKQVSIGVGAGWQQATDSSNNAGVLVKGIDGIVGGSVGGFQAIKNVMAENPVLKQAGLNNAGGYIGGVVAGVTGYQVGSRFASKINPYNSAVNKVISEPSEVMQMAQTVVGDNGVERIAPGAVRMVTTPDQSYIEVRTKTGQSRIVSRTGRGDSTMKKGEMVYQDLQVENGAFVTHQIKGANTSVYKVDSAGGKIPVSSSQVNVNPNKLLANRNTPKNPYVVQEVQAFNQQVDAGQFYLNDLKQHGMENVQLVIERDRSYMQATTPAGEKVRVSAYQTGDARIPQGKTVTKNCIIKGHKVQAAAIVEEEFENYTTTIQPEQFITPKPNKRFDMRNQQESSRKRQSLAGWNG
ncbi:hypothetical protein HPT25_27315 [Bacillus sp. BRMEA1]|uniref:hypothetical protein n=1 Tax=Neobacillus endophyticus TaxID=2738405 RepID=UPI001563CEDB|nr:hypothetical protein [Neobacillus endophyticus]NRD81031.1 hypothetical protein [Neobacillus endophyticus]